jgi:hypothetical protein
MSHKFRLERKDRLTTATEKVNLHFHAAPVTWRIHEAEQIFVV